MHKVAEPSTDLAVPGHAEKINDARYRRPLQQVVVFTGDL